MAITAPNPASNPDDSSDTVLEFPDNRLLIDLCGELDRNIVQVESRLGVAIHRRGNHLALHGPGPERELAEQVLRALYSRLEQLGVVEPRLAAWGSGGRLHRFCCRATVGGDANFKRHFEAIAAEPRLAVQEVVGKVEAWRTAQQKSDQLGTVLR